jgi:phosphoribosyl 1,2-cyclic phosphodiesterase
VRVTILASGSGGNSCLVESGATRVLVDAGLSARELERRLVARQVDPETIQALFLTHEHGDHASGALTFGARWSCPIFATAGTADAIGLDGTLFSPFVRVDSGREGRVGSIGFRALAIPHDANESVAYSFEATTVLLEFNHDEDMLRDGPYTWGLKKRISGGFGHLSNRQSADAVRSAAGPKWKRVVATHLSRTNNTPALALAALAEALERSGWEVPFDVADQIRGCEVFEA